MAELEEEIRQFVESAVEPLIEDSESIKVTIAQESPELLIEIESNPEDAGRIIGRQGRIIKSIRTIARAAGSREGIRVDVELVD